MTNFSRVGLIVKFDDDTVASTLNDVISCLEERQLDVVLEHSTRDLTQGRETVPMEQIAQRCDLAIVIGGDGTLLSVARSLVDHDVPIVGINRGRLGFLVDVTPDEKLVELNRILDGEYTEEKRTLLRTRIQREGECIAEANSFNDTVIRVHDRLQIMDFDIIIDGALVTHQRADGLIVATPSGSTAYSLSNGGPIVAPTVDALIVHPISPHSITSRPLLVEGGSRLCVHLWDEDVEQAQVICDGQIYMDAIMGDMVDIRQHPNRVRLLHPETYDYYRLLREKLNWG